MQFIFIKQREGKKLFMLLALFLFCEVVMAQEVEDYLQSVLKKIQEPHSVAKIDVVYKEPHMAPSVGSYRTPDQLDRWHNAKLTIQGSLLNLHLKTLRQALQDIKVEKTDKRANVAWGIIFFDKKNQRIASLYFEANRGYINTVKVEFISDKLVTKWLYDNFYEMFEKSSKLRDDGIGYSKELESIISSNSWSCTDFEKNYAITPSKCLEKNSTP